MPRRDLRTLAEAHLQDHREVLLAEASVVVERWRLEGKFGKRATHEEAETPKLFVCRIPVQNEERK
jgi:hypothetical protein